MNQPLSGDPSAPSPSHQSLDPALQAALGSLDVQLEAELVRYRRQRAGQAASGGHSFGPNRHHKPLDLLTVAADRDDMPPEVPTAGVSLSPIASPLDGVNPSEASSTELGGTIVPGDAAGTAQSLPIANVLAQLAQPKTVEESATDSSTGTSSPANYLESSERLLQSLADETESDEPASRSLFGSLLTPVGMGSLLLLLISSAILGYVLMNPASIRHLSWNRLLTTLGLGQPPNQDVTSETAEPLPTQPNLPNLEFTNLELNTLSLVEPGEQASLPPIPPLPTVPAQTPQPSVAPSALPAQPTPATSLQTPTPAASVTPAPAATPEVAEKPQPAQPSLTVATSPAPSPVVESLPTVTLSPPPAEFYYVIADYINERSLKIVQEEVPDAFVSPRFPELNRAPIQAGAFDTEESANRLVEELQQKGIPARVYRP